MLKKGERLKREEFNRFFSIGKRFHTPFFQCIYHPYSKTHISVVLPKKIIRSAVVRNTLRRRVYDLFRRYISEEKIRGVFIVIIKSAAVSKSYKELHNELTKLVGRIEN